MNIIQYYDELHRSGLTKKLTTRILADLNLTPSILRWWEKGGVGIIGKGTSRSFVSPWVSDCHALT